MEGLSCTVSNILDSIGYSQDIIKFRRNYWQWKARLLNENWKSFTMIIAGSKAEGLTSPYESDLDTMILVNDVICTDMPLVSDRTVLHTDTKNAPFGYTRLKLIPSARSFSTEIMEESIFKSESHEEFLSSSLFASFNMRTIRRVIRGFQIENLSGPAVTFIKLEDGMACDLVTAFPCYHSQLLHKWKTRQRPYNWPPIDVREKAASLLGQVVPVGFKGSLDQWREWRFCFIESELQLLFSLNETQTKLYILLKMVAKDILRNIRDSISSYIMKNIVFWLSELLSEDVFRKENLLSLLLLALRFLKSSITHWNWLPYYMIPKRNLLAEKLTPSSKLQISELLKIVLAEGPMLLLRCSNLQAAISVFLVSPYSLIEYRPKRNMIELLFYILKTLKLIGANTRDIFEVVHQCND